MAIDPIIADWPAPPHVCAIMTTRSGGVSSGAYASLNLGSHVGDSIDAVADNRRRLRAVLPEAPVWLDQVHGTHVVALESLTRAVPSDAVVSRAAGRVCAIMTADCLPVVLCDRDGSVVAAAHAGWRGLCDGVLERTVASMQVPPASLIAWMGVAIGPSVFEVGSEVRAAFVAKNIQAKAAFRPSQNPEKWFADIYLLAAQRLQACGVGSVYGGEACTFSEPDRFFSYRRDGVTGRMATCVWISGNSASFPTRDLSPCTRID